MLRKLANLAKTSAILREASLKKEANLGLAVAKGVGKAAVGVGKWAVKNPMKAVGIGLTATQAVPTAVGKFHQSQREFDPSYQTQKNQMMVAPGGTQ